MERSSRGEYSQEDLGNLRWGLGGESWGTQVCGVRRKRRRRVRLAIVTETKESLRRKISMCLSIFTGGDRMLWFIVGKAKEMACIKLKALLGVGDCGLNHQVFLPNF